MPNEKSNIDQESKNDRKLSKNFRKRIFDVFKDSKKIDAEVSEALDEIEAGPRKRSSYFRP